MHFQLDPGLLTGAQAEWREWHVHVRGGARVHVGIEVHRDNAASDLATRFADVQDSYRGCPVVADRDLMVEGRARLNGDRLDETEHAEDVDQVAGGVDARIADSEGPGARCERLDVADLHHPHHEGDGQEHDEPCCHSSRPPTPARPRRRRLFRRSFGRPNDRVQVATLLHRLPAVSDF